MRVGRRSPTLGSEEFATKSTLTAEVIAASSAQGRPGRLVRVAALVLFGVVLTGCNVALGEARRGDEPLRPIGDQLATAISSTSFPWTPAPGEGSGEIVQAPAGGAAEVGPTSA